MTISMEVPADIEQKICVIADKQAFLEAAVRAALEPKDRAAQAKASIAFFNEMADKLAARGGSSTPHLTKEEIYADGGP